MKLFLMIIVVAMPAGVFRAPAFLVCERPLKKADCVIAMLGGDFAVRKREALALIEKGVADVMLIPAWRQSGRCRKYVAAEYLKIAWFLVYSWFV